MLDNNDALLSSFYHRLLSVTHLFA